MSLLKGWGRVIARPIPIRSSPLACCGAIEPSSHHSRYVAIAFKPFKLINCGFPDCLAGKRRLAPFLLTGSKYSMPSHFLSSGRGRMWYRLAVRTNGLIFVL